MELPNFIPSPRLKSGIERAREIQEGVATIFRELSALAEERGDDGRRTARAKDARQALGNPDLNKTTVRVAMQAQRAERAAMIENCRAKEFALLKATEEYERAQIALEWHTRKYELFAESAPPPRSKTLAVDEVSHEEMTFLEAMRQRGVPVSAMDQGSGYERDFLSLFLKELGKPIDQRNPAGAWARTFSEGELFMPVRTMTDDQAEAIQIVFSPAREAAVDALKVLESAAGRPLKISPNFALMVVAIVEQANPDDYAGLHKNIETAERLAWERDVGSAPKALGLGPADFAKVRAILRGLPTTAPVATPAPVATFSQASDGFDLPGDVSQDAAAAYRNIAARWLDVSDEWDEDVRYASGHYYRPSRPPEPEIMRNLAAAVERPGTSDVVQDYHAIAIADGLAAADTALRQWGLRKATYEIATKGMWAKAREDAGYPRR